MKSPISNLKPLTPQLPDAPKMVFGYYFRDHAEWRHFTRLGSINRCLRLTTAWWRLNLWLQAQHQNWRAN